jgi:hypothetical protein
MTYVNALKAAGRLALAAQLVVDRIKLDATEIEALRRALGDYDAAVMELTAAQSAAPIDEVEAASGKTDSAVGWSASDTEGPGGPTAEAGSSPARVQSSASSSSDACSICEHPWRSHRDGYGCEWRFGNGEPCECVRECYQPQQEPEPCATCDGTGMEMRRPSCSCCLPEYQGPCPDCSKPKPVCGTCKGANRVWLCSCGWAKAGAFAPDACENCGSVDDVARRFCPDCTGSEASEVRPGDYDPRATDEQCRCPKCGSFRPGYPYHVKDPCLRCGYAPTGCCTVCREPDEIKPEGER